MKKLSILFAVLALGMTMLFTSCNPTTGLDQLSEADVTVDWVKGVWDGTSSYKDSDGNSQVTDMHFDYSGTITSAAGVIFFKAFATTGKLYANRARTNVVYYDTGSDDKGNSVTITVDLKKK